MNRLLGTPIAAVGLIVAAPLIMVAMLLIKCESQGPVIFAQVRVGRNGRLFLCYKLRTMYSDALDVPTHLADASQITKIGAFLRKSKLDELPQLWNVLKGDMSLVGPRPCLPSQTRLIEERRSRGVLVVLPGITGLAQVSGIDMSDPVRLAAKDAEYMSQRSFALDVELLYRTVFRRAGARDRVHPHLGSANLLMGANNDEAPQADFSDASLIQTVDTQTAQIALINKLQTGDC